MKPASKVLFHCLLALAFSTAAEACEKEWVEFLMTPTTATHEKLINRLTQCQIHECQTLTRPSSADVAELIRLVDARNPMAIDVGFSVLLSLNGGDLEDVLRSLGRIVEVDPIRFLTLAEKKKLSAFLLRKVLLMLPLDTVDDMEARASILHRRMVSLESVHQAELLPIRDKALHILNAALGLEVSD